MEYADARPPTIARVNEEIRESLYNKEKGPDLIPKIIIKILIPDPGRTSKTETTYGQPFQ